MTGGITLACRQVVPEGMERLVDAVSIEGPGAVVIVYCASTISQTRDSKGRWSTIHENEVLRGSPQIIGLACEGMETEAEAADMAERTLIHSWGRTYDHDDMRILEDTSASIVVNDYLPPRTVVPWAMIAKTTDTDGMPWAPIAYLLPRAVRSLPPDAVTENDMLAVPFDGQPPTTEVTHAYVRSVATKIYPWVGRRGPRPDLNHPVADLCEISERIAALGGLLNPKGRHWRLCRRRAEGFEAASDARISDLWVGTAKGDGIPKRLYVAEWDAMAGPLVAYADTPLDDLLRSARASSDDVAILVAKRTDENGNCAYYPNVRRADGK